MSASQKQDIRPETPADVIALAKAVEVGTWHLQRDRPLHSLQIGSQACERRALTTASPGMATISTLGEAFSAGWGVRMRCARGDHSGIVNIDRCGFEAKLDMETQVCKRSSAGPRNEKPDADSAGFFRL